MKKPWLMAFLVGTIALAMCVPMILVTTTVLGDPIQSTMFINSVLGSYGIGSPVAFFLCKQAEKLRIANARLQQMQEALAKAHDAMAQKVRIDQMTGFLNREYFFEAFHALHSVDRRHDENTLLMIDADHFKRINDRFGHLAGDAALEQITKAIQGAVRGHDIVGRIGGEEFAVLLPDTSIKDAETVAERIRNAVEALSFVPEGFEEVVPLTVSIGGSQSGGEAELTAVMRAADRNLYAAKDGGRNCVMLSETQVLAA